MQQYVPVVLPAQPHCDEVLGRCRWSEYGLPGAARGICGGDAADVIVADEEREGERLGDDLHALLVRVLLRRGVTFTVLVLPSMEQHNIVLVTPRYIIVTHMDMNISLGSVNLPLRLMALMKTS